MAPIQQPPQQIQQQTQFMPRGVINKQWRAQAPTTSNQSSSPDLVRPVPVFQANLQGNLSLLQSDARGYSLSRQKFPRVPFKVTNTNSYTDIF